MKAFTVLGPSGSGKSTLVAALARLDGAASEPVPLGDASLTVFRYLGQDWAAIEVPGGPDAMAAAGPALATSDMAVVCVPAEVDAAVLAAPYLRLTEEAGIPTLVFINKVDATTERVRDIVAALQAYCRHHIVLRQVPMRQGSTVVGAVDLISERAWSYREGGPSALVELPADTAGREKEARAELLESLADFDDELLSQLIEDKTPMTAEVFAVARKVVGHGDLVSAFLGAASHGNGVTRLMKSLRHECPDPDALRERVGAGPGVIAIGSLGDVRKHVGKLVLVRALGAGVGVGAQLAGASVGSITASDLKTQVRTLEPGAMGLTLKSDHLVPARLYTAGGEQALPAWAAARAPVFREVAAATSDRDDVRLSAALARLAEIDPGFRLEQDDVSGNAILATQGQLHARRLVERLRDDFGVPTAQSAVSPAYRETIGRKVEHHHRHKKQTGGAGQFADILIDLVPEPRGSGFRFEEVVKGGAVPRNYIPSVEAGAMEALKQGPHGFPVVDVRVVLKDGKHHAVDSSDFAFRTAGRAAVKEAMVEAGIVLLQPIVKVEIHVPSAFTGGLVPMISGIKGQVLGFEAHPTAAGWDVFTALLPQTGLEELYRHLGSATRGTAWFEASFDHHEETSAKELKLAEAAAG
jgi:elongation factor G